MKKNAIILAAGKSTRFAPFTYEKPKGLFRVKGEILIERQIEQLKAAGVDDIYIVIGYMKEKFFYLERKYGVTLILNSTFSAKGNIYSLYVAREFLDNTFICCADHYFTENPFIDNNTDNRSYRACSFIDGKFREFSVEFSDANVIMGFDIGGADKNAMIGHAYLNSGFSHKYREFMENEINDFGVKNMFWEELYARHMKELTLFAKPYSKDCVLEFDSVNDLRRFDSEFLINVDSKIITNICSTLNCLPNDIVDIEIIQAGLTNVSFMFTVNGVKYVYRHPGANAEVIINRPAEMVAQAKAKELGLDKSAIYMDASGWKISYFVNDIVECDFRKNPWQLEKATEYLRAIHRTEVTEPVRNLDIVSDAERLIRIACQTKGDLFEEFSEIIEKVEKINAYVEAESKRIGRKRVLSHNDVYMPNFLATANNDFYLIDWEFAGMNEEANDIACLLTRYEYTDEEIEHYLKMYVGRELTEQEHRYYMAYLPINAFYWLGWSLYRGSIGEDDGFFFLSAYHNFLRFIDKAIESYEEEGI